MNSQFDPNQAQRFLEEREAQKREAREKERIATLAAITNGLKRVLHSQGVEVYLVGSITQPYLFYPHSDIDIVVKNFQGDRFALWTELESISHRKIEIILFEKCPFKDHVLKHGYKVI